MTKTLFFHADKKQLTVFSRDMFFMVFNSFRHLGILVLLSILNMVDCVRHILYVFSVCLYAHLMYFCVFFDFTLAMGTPAVNRKIANRVKVKQIS